MKHEYKLTSLIIPLLNPEGRAEGAVGLEENLARSKVLTLGVDTLVVVNVGLPAVLGLVLVGVAMKTLLVFCVF